MVRYADDFVVLCPAGRGQQIQEQIKQWLAGKGLALNERKTRQVNIYREGIRFLGFRLNGRRSRRGRAYLQVEPETGSCAALRGRLCEILNQLHRMAFNRRCGERNQRSASRLVRILSLWEQHTSVWQGAVLGM